MPKFKRASKLAYRDDGLTSNHENDCTLDPDGTTFTLQRGAWANTYPPTDLPKWIAFYRRQAELVPSQPSYADDVQALEGLKQQLTA